MPKIVRTLFLPLIVLAIAAGIAYALMSSRPSLPQRESTQVVPLVEVTTIQLGPVPVAIQSRGIVSPRRNIELVTEVSGRVIWVDPGFLQGEEVREGQLLLRIDPIDYEVALSTAKASLASAELSLAEVKVLVQKAAITEAEAGVVAAKDRMRQAQVDLANTEIRAPFNAVVDIKRVDLGQYVQAGSALMKLLSTGVAEVRLPLLASDVPFVNYGQDAAGSWQELMLTATFGNIQHSWKARLARLERRVDEQTRVFYLVAQVDKPYDKVLHSHILAMGLFVEASFAGAPIPDAVRLPRSALHKQTYVYLVREGLLHRQDVTLFRREGDSVIVGEGLESSDQVVLSRLDLMVDGMAVQAGD
ncbi:MAG: efflux RND transporter periplasmic adaptor subunit [Halioglobus sp.]